MTKLKELVEIRSGYTFRTAIDTYPEGDVEVIQSKDLGDEFNLVARPKISFPGDDAHLLHPGEILFSARGFAKARVYRDTTSRAVASSSLFVLRPKSDSVSAAYITMFFNSIRGIKEVIKLSSGASVKTITKDDLGQIDIPDLPPDKEKALGAAVQAIDDYQALLLEQEIYIDHIRSTIISKTFKEINE